MENLPQSPTTPSFTEHIKEPRHMTLEIQILAWDRHTLNVREYRRGNQKCKNLDTQKHNTTCVGHHYTEANINNVNRI